LSQSQTAAPPAAEVEAGARGDLLQAASELMAESGSVDVSLAAIAARAGLTAPLVTYHFGNKEGMLLALARRDTAKALKQVQKLVAMDVTATEKMRLHILGMVRTYDRVPYLNSLLTKLLTDVNSEPGKALAAEFVRPLLNAQRSIVEEGVSKGEFKNLDPMLVYTLSTGATQHLFTARGALNMSLGGLAEDPKLVERFAETVADTILNGICK
jgi:AcrR family transcriptional regulator